MSHPNSQHDRDNEYPEDKVTHYPQGKSGQKKKKSHTIATRMQDINAKTRALKDKMGEVGGRFTVKR